MTKALVVVLCVAAASPAYAQVRLGVRAGASAIPGFVWFGAHLESSSWLHLSLRQSLDAGVGEGIALGSDIEVLCRIPIPKRSWSLYLGGGTSGILSSYVGGGGAAVAGVQLKNGMFVDAHVGFGGVDGVPLRLNIGYVIKRRPKPK